MKRRTFLKGTVTGGMLGIAASAGLLMPKMVLAAWPKSAFDATKMVTSKSRHRTLQKMARLCQSLFPPA